MKPDSPTHFIVAALRQLGASVEHHEGSPGSPDLIIGYKGRMFFAEVKAPGKEHGVCGCTGTLANGCGGPGRRCNCMGHPSNSFASPRPPNRERKVYHRQLAWHESWAGPSVRIWTTVEQAVREVMG